METAAGSDFLDLVFAHNRRAMLLDLVNEPKRRCETCVVPAMEGSTGSSQTVASITANAQYFLRNLKQYQEFVSTIDTYRTIHDHISRKVAGVDRLLDVGNGGVFSYDPSKVGTITAIDLFFNQLPSELLAAHFPSNARPKPGTALALPEPDKHYDMVLIVMLLHHLAGQDWRSSWENARKAIDEAWRVLRPGGRCLIIESCVPRWFFQLEKPAFSILSRLTQTVFSHPVTFQFPVDMIVDELKTRSSTVEVEPIPKGRYVLQFGIKMPSWLTPAAPFSIMAKKQS
jgi:SAM-dependent methyltransferase